MANLDISAYDLTTVEGQQDIIQDIIVEQNNQFDNSQTMTNYQVVAYKRLSITTIADSVAKKYITSFQHGLGFNPVIISFINDPSTEFSPLPKPGIDISGGSPYRVPLNAYITVDNQNVYFNVDSTGTTGATFSIAVYVFNIPAIF